jgi:outer membrane protein
MLPHQFTRSVLRHVSCWSGSQAMVSRARTGAAISTALAVGLTAGGFAASAEAQSLKQAMIAAYRNNPSLQSQRFRTRASDEIVAEARAGYRPRVTADAYAGVTADRSKRGDLGDGKTYGVSLSIEQPLFDGFQTHYAVREAKSGVLASRNELRAQENEILLQAASAYFDVLRDEGILLYRRKALNALKRELIGARERMQHGDATVTDVEQSRQRVALAQSDLERARGQLEVSRLKFARIVGQGPRDLRMPQLPARFMPKSRRRAVEVAFAESPIIAAALHQHDAARYAVDKAKGALLPTASIVGGYDRSFNDRTTRRDEDDLSLVGRVRVPLYQGGGASARVRRARALAQSRDRDVLDQRNRIGEAVGAAWSELAAARRRLGLEQRAVGAAERALNGIREEQRVGTRTLTDVLDAERELVNARIRVLDTRRDLNVSAFALLRAMGTLTIANFAPEVARYEPGEHYDRVNAKWWGTATPKTSGDSFLGERGAETVVHAAVGASRLGASGVPRRTATSRAAWQTTIKQR